MIFCIQNTLNATLWERKLINFSNGIRSLEPRFSLLSKTHTITPLTKAIAQISRPSQALPTHVFKDPHFEWTGCQSYRLRRGAAFRLGVSCQKKPLRGKQRAPYLVLSLFSRNGMWDVYCSCSLTWETEPTCGKWCLKGAFFSKKNFFACFLILNTCKMWAWGQIIPDLFQH